MANIQERRRYSRVVMDLHGYMVGEGGGQQIPVKILDLSLKGALLEMHDKMEVNVFVGEHLQCFFSLDATSKVHMHTVCRHVSGRRIGLECVNIDASSISHLKRLIEFNVGNSDLNNRELKELSQM